jgi:transposase
MGCRMKRFVEGADRSLSILFPKQPDDYINEANPVWAIDVVADKLDLGELGFAGMRPAVTGHPAYYPSTLLKIHMYGCLNHNRSIEY